MAGVDDVTPHIEVEGADEAAAEFLKVGDAAEEAFDKVGKAASKVAGASEGFEQLASGAKRAFSDIGMMGAEALNKIIEGASHGNFGPVIGMFSKLGQAVYETTEKLVKFVEEQASMVETLANLGEATGMSISQIEGLKDAFASVGISTSGFERSVGRLAMTIGNEWASIQQSVRTASDQVQSAQLAVAESAFHVQKAWHDMGSTLTEVASNAAHNILHVEEAALSVRRALQEIADFSLKTQQSSLSIEGAQLSLARARMNLAKDSGQSVSPQDEKALKLAQDRLQVKEAELHLEEASKKKAKEGMEMEELQLRLKKAKQEMVDAENKKIEDSIKNSDKLKEAEFAIQKAKLAARETQEKQHEVDLKNIPEIAKQVEQVAAGYQKWDDVMNHAEISAQNLTKAVILAASGGSSQPPKAEEVFKKMAGMFANMGDSADAMNKKLELVQHTMAAGFRSGQASAAQLLAVLERGPQALEDFEKKMKEFSESGIGLTDKHTKGFKEGEIGFGQDDVSKLKEFNSQWAQLNGIIDQVKGHFAALMAPTFTEWFKSIRESITEAGGALNNFLKGLANPDANGLKQIAMAATQVWDILKGMVGSVIELLKWFTGIQSAEAAWKHILVAIDFVNIALIGIKSTIAILIMAVGAFAVAWNTAFGDLKLKDFNENLQKNPMFAMGKDMFKEAGKDLTEAGKTLAKDIKAAYDANQKADEKKKSGAGPDTSLDKLTGATDKTSSSVDKLGSGASSAADSLAKLTAAAAAANPPGSISDSSGDAEGKATGGLITGPGGPTSDSAGIFALSDGEYVVRSAAVSHYGPSLFEALNNLAVGGFATGGLVRGASVPAGSTQGPSSVLNLSIDGQHFNGLQAPDHVAAKLKTYAVSRQSSSAGRMPSWMR